MVCYSTAANLYGQPQATVFCPAKTMTPWQRRGLALEALAGSETISQLARQHQISRKFVYQQAAKAEESLDEVFRFAPHSEDEAIFHLPVSKDWLRQLVLGLTLICHSSIRGVTELLCDVFDYPISVGTVHAILVEAVEQARSYNNCQDLCGVRIGAHDEIFQNGQPVLVGADVDSTYCYLLSLEDQRDGETWGIRLLELQDRGFHPEATIADAGSGLRAGQNLAMPEVPCRGDIFHVLQTVQPLVTSLENKAYEAIAARTDLERKKARLRWRGQRTPGMGRRIAHARQTEDDAIALADDVALLFNWLRYDILSLAGPDHATRRELYDFVVAELRARQSVCLHGIGSVIRTLSNQRDQLLAFAARLDENLAALASQFQLPLTTLREVFNTEALPHDSAARWPREAALQERLGNRFFAVSVAVAELVSRTTRASSVIENLNSRLRSYFFLRRHLGPDYLTLLQFFLNHRRFLRSERPQRVGKSPAELLTGKGHPHWLEMLGYARFSRN